MTAFADYLAELQKAYSAGDATEHTHRPALKRLIESAGKDITATNEPKRILCGSPDFQIARKGVPLGHVETKDIGTDLDEVERGRGPHGGQFIRYRDGLPNWILTDYLEFRWFVAGQRRLTVRVGELDAKGRIKGTPEGELRLAELLAAFFAQAAPTVGTAKDLARRMAGMTRMVRDLIVGAFDHEKDKGWLHNWLAAFRETLIPDLDEPQFADMFAQTLAYGLFAARVHTPQGKAFTREMAAYSLPKTNPFLRKLFAEIGGVDMPDPIAWAVDDLVELLKHADMAEILADFGKGKGKEDPVVHFYETFLAAYDPKMRELRGVYYTPEPVVGYIVRSIDHLLRTRLGRAKGLADEKTLILDPASGTATFLYFVIGQIRRKFARQAGAWDDYVAKHLLNRVFGFELLMAPYAVAHLKLGMQLQETGYQFGSDQRLGIFLTNTLEAAARTSEQLFAAWVADEANAAAEIKRDKPIMVVLGNPPYSGISANRSEEELLIPAGKAYLAETAKGEVQRVAGKSGARVKRKTFIGRLIEDYKRVDGRPLGERKHWLQDDYVKFIRFAEWRIDRTGEGVVGLITNHGYLDNPTFRGMRQHLMRTFGEIFVLNLHGSAKKREKAPDGGKDENVFDIQQGVAVLLCVKRGDAKTAAAVNYADLWGDRRSKYERLASDDVARTRWKKVKPSSPFYLFVPHDGALRAEYDAGWRATDIFPLHGVGAVMARDSLTVAFEQEELRQRLREFISLPVEDARARFALGKDARDWKVATAQADLRAKPLAQASMARMLYRPFDHRWTCYTGKSKGFYASACSNVLFHLLSPNLGLVTSRSVETGGFEHVLCTRSLVCHHSVSLKEVNYLFPLYLYPNGAVPPDLFAHENGAIPNLSAEFVDALAGRLALRFVPEGKGNLRKTFGPEDVFHYAYAVLHSPAYRARYAEFLKIDFPRVPLTGDANLFRALAAKGAELVSLHVLESSKLDDFLTDWPVKGDNVVESVRYAEKDRRVWVNKTQYFGGVPPDVWQFQIGGYRVCHRWLKDRKGRKLTYEDTQHYQRVVVALHETIRLMSEIDALIPAWPMK